MGDGATTIHSNDIAVTQDRMHQFGGGLGHRLDPVYGVVAVGGDRISVLQRVLALQGGRQLNFDRREILYLDRARFQGCRHPGHLEPRQPETFCDLDPRACLQVIASRNHPALEKLVWSHDAGHRHRIRCGQPAAVHLLFPQAGRSATVNSLKLGQDEIASTLRLVDQARLVELTEAFADRTWRWFVSGHRRHRLVASMPAMRVGFDVHLARRAADLSARVLAITTREDSSLAAIADVVVAVPVQGSGQFGGSLFEQDPHAYKTMSRRHTNLEFRQ